MWQLSVRIRTDRMAIGMVSYGIPLQTWPKYAAFALFAPSGIVTARWWLCGFSFGMYKLV